MIPSDDPTQLSLLFHLNSEPWLNDDAYQSTPYHQAFKQIDNVLSRNPLPPPTATSVAHAIRKRKSERHFSPRTMPLATLSAVLEAAYGAVEIASIDGGGSFLRRSVPSGGGLFPLEIYLYLQRVEGIEDGIYHYDVMGHALEFIRGGHQAAELAAAFYTYPFCEHANVVLCHAAVFERTQRKYGPRGYRYILLEAGHSAQNICLVAAELGLGSLCMGGFIDTLINRSLGLTPCKEGVVYAIAVGHHP